MAALMWGETDYMQAKVTDKLNKKVAVSPTRPITCSILLYHKGFIAPF